MITPTGKVASTISPATNPNAKARFCGRHIVSVVVECSLSMPFAECQDRTQLSVEAKRSPGKDMLYKLA